MGMFSWKTQDTNHSIPSKYSIREPFTVYMIDNEGNKYKEEDYEGYGVFGGKDYYELLAEMNGLESDRDNGITLKFSDEKCITPNLVEDENWKWRDEAPEDCEYQGFFYDD